MTKVINTIIISFGTLSEFFLIFSKKIVRCVEAVFKCTERKTSKKTLEKMVFRFSWTLTRKTCSFTGEFLTVLSKLLSTCPEVPLKNNISERKSWKLQDFPIIFEVFGTMAENFFQVWQNTNRCPREHFLKTFFQKRDIRWFFRFWAISLLLAKNFARFAKPATKVSVEVFGENHIWNLYVLPHFFEVWSKKCLVGNFFAVCLNCNPRVQRHFLSKSNFLLKIVEFGQLFRSLSNFACLLTKKSGYQGNNLLIRKKMVGKVCRKIVFLNHFRIPNRKFWTIIEKILARLSGLFSKCSEEQF